MPNILRYLNEDYIHGLEKSKLYDKAEYNPTKISGRQYESIFVSKDKTVFKLIDKIQHDTTSFVAGEYVTYHNQDFFEVRGTYSRVHGRGYSSHLFDLLIYDFNLKIISDATHTSPGSKEFWQSLMRKKNFQVYRYDKTSNYKRKAENFRDDEIWGLTQKEKDNLELRKKEFQEFEEINPLDVIDDRAFRTIEDEGEDFLNDFGSLNFEVDPRIIQYQEFIKDYKELIKCKENIRLIAEKSNRG